MWVIKIHYDNPYISDAYVADNGNFSVKWEDAAHYECSECVSKLAQFIQSSNKTPTKYRAFPLSIGT